MSSFKKVPDNLEDVSLEWLNTALNPQGIKVLSLKWAGEAMDGRGCLSSIERIKLQVSHMNANELPDLPDEQQLSLVIKTLPKNSAASEFAVDAGFCTREVRMYTQVFPDMEKFVKSRCPSLDFQFRCPKCYYGAEEGANRSYKYILLLEDMIESNYVYWMEGQAKDLQWSYSSAVVRQLAILHGVTLAYKISENISSFLDKYPFLMNFAFYNPAMQHYIDEGFKRTYEMYQEDGPENVPEGLMDKLKVMDENSFDIVKTLFPDSPDGVMMSCVRHCDLHTNNLMFQQTSTETIRANLLDFQACAWGPPMADLSFFLFLTSDPSIPTTYISKVIKLYHEVFTEVMTSLKIDIQYTVEEMTNDFRHSVLSAILHIISGAPGWIFGPGTSEETKNRFKSAILFAHQEGLLAWPQTTAYKKTPTPELS